MKTIPPQLVGDSEIFHALLDRVSALASLDKPLLIVGERGTGKSLIASRLHFLSPRWEQVYVSFDCAAYSAGQQEAHIFGTGGFRGCIERVEGGTLFLDNIDAMALSLQARLVPLIEHGLYDSGGGRPLQKADIRLLAALQSDGASLQGHDKAENFVLDALLDSLVFDSISIPPLRHRPEDIDALTLYFGRKMTAELGAAAYPGLSAEIAEYLRQQSWPGNIRELKTVIERAVTRAFLRDGTLKTPISEVEIDALKLKALSLRPAHFAAEEKTVRQSSVLQGSLSGGMNDEGLDFPARILQFERSLIDEAMTAKGHHQGRAANYLGLTYHQFRGLLRKHGLKK